MDEHAGRVQVEDRRAELRTARSRLTRAHGYVVCGHLLGWNQDGAPRLCALPSRHLGAHRQAG